MPYDLGGKASVNYAPDGLEVDFCIPGRHVAEHNASPIASIRYPGKKPGHSAPPPQDLLKGERVLLVEDSLIIALDAEDIFERLGADHVSTASSVEAALDIIAAEPPTLAVLDINLGSSTSFAIADELLDLGIPFMFATGYGEQAQFPDQHRGRLVLQKPYTIENMARTLATLLA